MEKFLLCCFFGLSVIAVTEGVNHELVKLVKGSNKLTRTLFFDIVKEYPGQSFVVSAVAPFNILGLFSMHSRGNTSIAITNVMGTRNITAIKNNLKLMNHRTFDNIPNRSLKYAARIYADDEYRFCPNFKKAFSKYFKGTTGNIDFYFPEDAAKNISRWISRKENTNIGHEDLVDATFIKKDGFVIVNYLKLELNYNTTFNPKRVKVMDFYKSNKIKTKSLTLYGTGIVKYASLEKYDAKFISVGVNDGDLTLFIALPNKINGLSTMLKNIKGTNVFEEAQAAQQYVCADIYLPLGRTGTQADLTNILRSVKKLDVLFDKKCSDTFGVTKYCKPGVIGSILSEFLVVDKIVEDDNSNNTKPNLAETICPQENLLTIEVNHPYAYSILNNVVRVFPQPIIFSGVHYA